jgi:ectoine hydroxylase-related dioxygenase (phytanoyl-CoA dioxygenase family)
MTATLAPFRQIAKGFFLSYNPAVHRWTTNGFYCLATNPTGEAKMLTQEQIEFYNENGYLHIPQLFSPTEIGELSDEMDRLVEEWAFTSPGWTGPWRQAYMDPETEKQSKLTAMHDLHYYSAAWCGAVTHPRLAAAMSDLLGPNIELHHSTMHIKPPQTGHPFPMHQDNPFYEHTNGAYIDVLVHLDDTRHENGEIRFLAGSHKLGALKHITETADGPCTPHLSFDDYQLEDTTPVPAKRGDVVCFNLYTIHGSYINTTKLPRRLVRIGYRDPENTQVAGQSLGRPGLMVHGYRQRHEGQPLFKQS